MLKGYILRKIIIDWFCTKSLNVYKKITRSEFPKLARAATQTLASSDVGGTLPAGLPQLPEERVRGQRRLVQPEQFWLPVDLSLGAAQAF